MSETDSRVSVAAVKNYAYSHGIRIVKYFEELGVSGTRDLEDRP